MSNERVTAISFMINGRQAEQTLEKLTKRAEELREAIDAAQESGDSRNAERLNRELEGVNREITIINRNVRSVENALEYLRGVTKEDVKYGMDYWKEQADGLKIGSEAWEKAFNSYISYKADILEWILSQVGVAEVWQTSFSISEEFLRRLFFICKGNKVSRINLVLDHKATNKTLKLWAFITQEMMLAQVGSPLAIENAHRSNITF